MSRRQVLSLLIACFVAVSAVAYSDYPRRSEFLPLDELERAGLSVWRRNNCQACHQIHGFGGFHGPDLTNRVTEETVDEQILQVVLRGKGRMPSFDLSDDEQQALIAWLRMLDYTGRSVARPLERRRTIAAAGHFHTLLAAWTESSSSEVPLDVQSGLETWTKMSCGSCHEPFAAGRYRAPDLAARMFDRALEPLSAILDEGRGQMPATELDGDEKRGLQALFEWMVGHRGELVTIEVALTELEPFSWSAVPWFEFR